MCDTETDAASAPSLADSHADLSQLFKYPDSTSQEVVRSVFGLKHVEARAYLALLEHPHSSANEIAHELNHHRRYVSRMLRGAYDAGLVEREEQIFDSGGQGYIYDPVPVEEAKQYLKEQLNEWVAHLRAEIEDFDTDIEATLALDGGLDECSHEEVD